MPDDRIRCPWSVKTEAERLYHDSEWGVPCRDDARQFEFLVLESAQAGLSWRAILLRREGYRRAFAGFDPALVAEFTPADVQRLMDDTGIIRNRKKIESAVGNARLFLEIQARRGSFCNYIWDFVDGRPIVNHWKEPGEVPAVTPLSDALAKDMKRLGFRFLGSTTLYAHMQAAGLVNDHLTSCFRHGEVLEKPTPPPAGRHKNA